MLLTVKPWFKIVLNISLTKMNAHHAKEYSLDVIEFTMRANESCFDKFEFHNESLETFSDVHNYADIP